MLRTTANPESAARICSNSAVSPGSRMATNWHASRAPSAAPALDLSAPCPSGQGVANSPYRPTRRSKSGLAGRERTKWNRWSSGSGEWAMKSTPKRVSTSATRRAPPASNRWA